MITYEDLYKSPAQTFTGYEYGNETDQVSFESLKQLYSDSSYQDSWMDGGKDIPDEVDFSWHVQENQMRQGSCQGHMLTSCLEGCFWIDTKGQTPVQLSRNAAYRFSQIEDGISGDQGSTLSGGVTAAKKGIPLEDFFPYTETYSRRIPKSAYENRKDFRLALAVPIEKTKPSKQVVDWIGKGKGFCGIGIKWTSEMDNQSTVRRYTGRGRGGGHAVCFLGYSLSRNTLKLVNSWGYGWGNNGVKEVSFEAFDSMMRHGWNMGYLYSDLVDIEVTRDVPDFSIIKDVV